MSEEEKRARRLEQKRAWGREYARRQRAKDPEKAREKYRQWLKNNREKAREASRNYRKKNLKKVSESFKAWRLKNLKKLKENHRIWRKAKNPERWKELHKSATKNWQKKHPEKVKELAKKWREKNPEKAKAKYRRWYEKNREKAKKSSKNWQKNNPDSYKLSGRVSKAKRAGQIDKTAKYLKATSAQLKKLRRSYGDYCPCCHQKVGNDKLSRDEIIPLSLRGKFTIENIQFICKNCNSRKKNIRERIIKYLPYLPEEVIYTPSKLE